MTKAELFRVFNKKFYKIAENGTLEDLIEARIEMDEAVEANKLFKSDVKILMKARVYAERMILKNHRW